jgi:hypothetical protein
VLTTGGVEALEEVVVEADAEGATTAAAAMDRAGRAAFTSPPHAAEELP